MFFKFKADSGTRIHRYFYGVTDAVRNGEELYWLHNERKWVTREEAKDKTRSNFSKCKTFKSFKRHVRKHNLDSALLSSKFVGHDVEFNSFGRIDEN